MCFSPDGTRLASGSWDHTAKVWDAGSGQETLTLKGHTGPVRSVVFSPDGTRLATSSSDQTIKIWDAGSGQETLTLKGHANSVDSVCFSPDGTRLASASWDHTAKVWDAGSGQDTLILRGDGGPIRSVSFSPDGKRIVSAARGPDGADEVQSWEARTGAPLPAGADAPPPGSGVLVARSPDGRLLVAARGSTLIVRRLDGPSDLAEHQEDARRSEHSLSRPASALKLEGKYSCSGTNPSGGKYGGITVEIRVIGDDYWLTWTGNGANDEGEGILVGNELVVTFKGTTGRGIVAYKLQLDGTLIGIYRPKGSKKDGEEILKPKGG